MGIRNVVAVLILISAIPFCCGKGKCFLTMVSCPAFRLEENYKEDV
jgi:hypothetical protein